ncbi:hypothetical protein CEXT_466841 [Caerostris extrusa]|uniref:Uncharacterized protein n=1 Tax=Caerostris extrusa TaxID=172846 RepID=A0AAV4RML1_CAEEX|nr:hypothetical protein CEXT_466841 [Caerostris extrusa]
MVVSSKHDLPKGKQSQGQSALTLSKVLSRIHYLEKGGSAQKMVLVFVFASGVRRPCLASFPLGYQGNVSGPFELRLRVGRFQD